MLKQSYQKAFVSLGMLMAGVSPVDATDITVDTFKNANLDKGMQNLEKGAHIGSNVMMKIITTSAIVIGVVLFLWGAYMAASKDTREEGKLKDGLKLAMVGIIFMTIGYVLIRLTGTDVISGY